MKSLSVVVLHTGDDSSGVEPGMSKGTFRDIHAKAGLEPNWCFPQNRDPRMAAVPISAIKLTPRIAIPPEMNSMLAPRIQSLNHRIEEPLVMFGCLPKQSREVV